MNRLTLAALLLCGCLEPGPGARPALDLPMPVAPTSITECWLAYICFDGCEDFECAVDCREEHPVGADQAGVAWYQATIFGENDARNACFTGAFGVDYPGEKRNHPSSPPADNRDPRWG